MGCVLGKTAASHSTTSEVITKLKLENRHTKGVDGQRLAVKESGMLFKHAVVDNKIVLVEINGVSNRGGGGGEDVKAVGKEGESVNDGDNKGNVSQRIVVKKIAVEELVDGWPKWLVDNVSKEVLSGLVPKSADSYDKLAKIGQGTYSNVYKARERESGRIVALKKVRFDTSEPESIKFMAREITILLKLDHPNVIKLEGLATSRMQYSLYLVFDFMQGDLTKVISRPGERLTEPQIKLYMNQLLSGLQHCHERGILHRDIKSSNLLVDRTGMLKIADFGLANSFVTKPKRPLTSRVVTLWYRAPELLLGSTDYGVGIDLWSAGCLLAEMFVGRPFMPGRTEVEQLHKIFKLCGSPTEDYWKKMRLPTSFRPPQNYRPSFQEVFMDFPSSSVSILTTLLALDPACRGTAASALQSEFFCSSPLACEISDLPVLNKEELQQTIERKKRRSKTKQSSRKKHEGHQRKVSFVGQIRGDTDSSRELEKNADTKMQGSEPGGQSASSSSSSVKQTRHGNSLQASLSPALHPNQKRFAGTEAHPNATKNIQNFTLLQASITDIVNHNRGNAPKYRRSISTLDFRTLDPEKISQLFGLDKDF